MNPESDEMKTPAPAAKADDPPAKPPLSSWEYREEFKIVGEMRKVINLAVDASEYEISMLRRKIEKLKYGS